MNPHTFISMPNGKSGLERELSSSSLGATNDNSNPQQGNGARYPLKKTTDAVDKGVHPSTPNDNKQHLTRIDPNKKEDRKLFVGGLPGNVTDEEFRVHFEQYGPVLDSVVMFDRETQNSRGFGFVTFEDVSVAQAVLGGPGKTKNIVTINGKECEVKVSVPKRYMDTKRTDRKHRNVLQEGETRIHNRNSRHVASVKPPHPNEKVQPNAYNKTVEYGEIAENMQPGVDGPMNYHMMNPGHEIPHFVNYSYPHGNPSMPSYMGHPGMVMYHPANYSPQAQPGASMQNVPHDQNAAYSHYHASPYHNQMNQPYIAYPVAYPQMMYPYMMHQQPVHPHESNPNEQCVDAPVSEINEKAASNENVDEGNENHGNIYG